MHYKNIGYILQ